MLNYRKRKWMINQYEKGMPVTDICKAQQVTRKVFYTIKDAYKQGGLSALEDKQLGRPKQEIPEDLRKLVIRKKKETGFGIRRIEGILGLESIHVPHNKIHEILNDAGLVDNNPKKGKRYKYVRWERDHSNSLWQTDFCWIEKLDCWLTAWLDDHSRFITIAEYVTEATTDTVIELFEKAAKRHGYPRETLSDQGTQYCSQRGEDCRFLDHLRNKGVKHIYASVKKPTTCGKIERFWGTHNRERWNFASLRNFITYYNHKRPHMSLGWYTPHAVYMRDMK